MGERDAQRVREFLDEGENLVAYVKGKQGHGSLTVILVLVFGILSTLIGKGVYLIVSDKRLIVAPTGGGAVQAFQLSELQRVKYHVGMSWLSSFLYPAWISIVPPAGDTIYVNLTGGSARNQGKALVNSVV